MQGDAVLDGFNMCILIIQVPGPGGTNSGVEQIFHALPELLGRFRSECQEVRHLATATEPARLQLAARRRSNGVSCQPAPPGPGAAKPFRMPFETTCWFLILLSASAIRTYPMPAGYSGVDACAKSPIFPVRASAALACCGTSSIPATWGSSSRTFTGGGVQGLMCCTTSA